MALLEERSVFQLGSIQQSSSIINKSKLKQANLPGCDKGDLQLAISNVRKLSNRYDQGEEVPYNVDVEYFKKYGAGVYLFFQLTKRLALLFFIYSLISIIPIVLNLKHGNGFSSIVKTLGIYFAQTTIGSLTNNPLGSTNLTEDETNRYKLQNIIPDLLICFSFLVFYLYWEFKSEKLTEEIKEDIKFQCHYTLELKQFPQGATEEEIQYFFSQFGKVKEIAPVINYSQLIDYSKDIFQLQQSKKQTEIEVEKSETPEERQKLETKIQQMNKKIGEIEAKCMEVGQESAMNVLKYYIVFEETSSRQVAVKKLSVYQKCFSWGTSNVPHQYLMKNQKVKVSACHNEPANIIWQNQHIKWYQRLIRGILQTILLIIVVGITFCIIGLFNISAPSTSTDLDVTMFNSNSIQSVTDQTILYVWCLDYKSQMDSNPAIKALCTPYITKYYYSLAIGVLISCIVVGVKWVLKKIVIALAKFQRYKDHTEQSIGVMKFLLYTYLSTTTLTAILLQAKIFGLSFKYFILQLFSNSYLRDNTKLLIQFQDFVPFWYSEIGYKINLTIIIMAFSGPIVFPIFNLIKQKFRMWRASRQLTQQKMEAIITPQNFDIEDHYANILLIMIISCTFSSGMPLIMIPCGIALVIRHFYLKFMFIRFNHIPNSLSQALNLQVIKILPFILLFHFLFGIWMFSTQSIFAHQTSFVNSLIEDDRTNFPKQIGGLLMRLGDTWYFTIALLISICVYVLKAVLYDLIYQSIKGRSDQKNPTEKISQVQKRETIQIKVIAAGQQLNHQLKISSKSLTNSYKIQNNPKYFQILIIMDKLRKFKKKQHL